MYRSGNGIVICVESFDRKSAWNSRCCISCGNGENRLHFWYKFSCNISVVEPLAFLIVLLLGCVGACFESIGACVCIVGHSPAKRRIWRCIFFSSKTRANKNLHTKRSLIQRFVDQHRCRLPFFSLSLCDILIWFLSAWSIQQVSGLMTVCICMELFVWCCVCATSSDWNRFDIEPCQGSRATAATSTGTQK